MRLWWYVDPSIFLEGDKGRGVGTDQVGDTVGGDDVSQAQDEGFVAGDLKLDGERLVLPSGWMRCTRHEDGKRAYAIPSKSVEGLWHLVTLQWCDCRRFRFVRTCSHVEMVRRFVAQARGRASEVPRHPVPGGCAG